MKNKIQFLLLFCVFSSFYIICENILFCTVVFCFLFTAFCFILLMKLKPHLDAEAVVIAHRSGAGKYRGLVGALEVETPDRRRFLVGSGLTDALRRDPPRPGEVITYRYRDLTSSGLPRFATYLRRHDAL